MNLSIVEIVGLILAYLIQTYSALYLVNAKPWLNDTLDNFTFNNRKIIKPFILIPLFGGLYLGLWILYWILDMLYNILKHGYKIFIK